MSAPPVHDATIQLFNGHYWNYKDPSRGRIDVETIAHSLANTCRFTGHCLEFYSVAQHCVLMSYIVPAEHALWGLCHEPEEPLTGDLNKPFKVLLDEMTGGVITRFVKEQERPVLMHVFGLDPDCKPDTIKPADHVMLATEQRDLMPKQRAIRWDEYGFAVEWEPIPPENWYEAAGITPLVDRIIPWTPAQAKAAFLRRYLEIVKGACGEQEGTLHWSQARRTSRDPINSVHGHLTELAA